MNRAVAVIVAGGKGVRAGDEIPKQWQMLLGRRVVDWSIDTFSAHPDIAEIVVVASDALGPAKPGQRHVRVTPGETRTGSVINGLKALRAPPDAKVLIHDAARPGLEARTVSALLAALEEADAAAPALPVSDALKAYRDGTLSHVDRAGLWRVQTPQAFRLGAIRDALESADADLVDDLAALDPRTARVKLIPGSMRLSKITFAEDFDMVGRLLAPAGAPRIGKGFDVHAFEPGDHVMLCGVSIPHTSKLQGHSDADAAWHALTDAILGAVALGDIGDHFPPTDPRWKNADSGIFLKHAQDLALERGFAIANCDITVICEAPKVKPHREAMRARTASLLGLPIDAVSVKATTTEGLGFTGRREGIAAEAVAVLMPSR